jgi:hypothetical protein
MNETETETEKLLEKMVQVVGSEYSEGFDDKFVEETVPATLLEKTEPAK